MAELTTDRVRKAWGDVNAWSITCGTKPSDFFPEFDAWHRKELAKAWEEGARAGWGASTDAGLNSASYTYEEAEISNDNHYKKEA